MSRYAVPNPAARQLRPVELITDRAKRYRAQNAIPPETAARCVYCGRPEPKSGRAFDVEHIDGNEANVNPANLTKACRSCNTTKGAVFAKAGIGKRTRQFNPAAKSTRGAQTLGQWLTAVMSTKGMGDMPVRQAVQMIHDTPASKRSEFAAQIWQKRRDRADEVPF